MLLSNIKDIVNGRCVTFDGGPGSGVEGHKTFHPEETNGPERERTIEFVKKESPLTKLEFSSSGRKVKLIGPDGVAEVQQGVGDKKWRVRYGNSVDLVSDMKSGIEYILDYVDNEFSKKKFKKQSEIAKAGEAEEE